MRHCILLTDCCGLSSIGSMETLSLIWGACSLCWEVQKTVGNRLGSNYIVGNRLGSNYIVGDLFGWKWPQLYVHKNKKNNFRIQNHRLPSSCALLLSFQCLPSKFWPDCLCCRRWESGEIRWIMATIVNMCIFFIICLPNSDLIFCAACTSWEYAIVKHYCLVSLIRCNIHDDWFIWEIAGVGSDFLSFVNQLRISVASSTERTWRIPWSNGLCSATVAFD